MPFRKTYHVNNREQGKIVQRDQSYKSCLATLLIFFFMCLILILASVSWRTRYSNHEPQHHYGEHMKEETNATILTTQRTSTTKRGILSNTQTPETTITRTTKNYRSTEEVDIISTKDNSKKNVKGPRMFEHYHENKTNENKTTTFSTSVHHEVTENYITKYTKTVATEDYIQKSIEITKQNIDSITLPRDVITDNVIDNGTSSTSPIIDSTTKDIPIVEVVNNATTSKSTKEAITVKYSIDEYSSDKSEVEIVINNVTIPTLSTHLNELEENTFENSTKQLEKLRNGVVTTDNIVSSTPSLQIDFEESTSVNSFFNRTQYSEKSQFEVTTNDITVSTSSTLSDLKENRNTENFTTEFLNSLYESKEYNATLIDKNVTRESSPVINYTLLYSTNEKFSTTTEVKNEAEDMINKTMNADNRIIEKYNENVTSGKMENYSVWSNYANISTTSVFNYTTSTAIPISYDEMNFTTTLLDENTNVCETKHCKQIVSRMLSYMNHSADPCYDFYEYACGGFEANPQLTDEDLVRKSKNYQRIANQMLKEKRENVHSPFTTYYDSCVQYERDMSYSERIKMASDALKKIGKFYISMSHDNHIDFTDLFARLMLHHSALLFDVVPELDDHRPNSFTLKIGPTTYESPFKAEYVEDSCLEDQVEAKYVDLEMLYNNYIKCKNNTSDVMRSIRKALIELDVFRELNDSYLEWDMQSKTIHIIDSVIMQKYFSHFPSKSKIQETYLMNDYSGISLIELQSNSAFINWTQLIRSLTGIVTNEKIHIYFYTALIKGLNGLEEYAKEDSMGLNNAIMGLYAHKLYQELVLPKHDNVKNYCLHVASYLLQIEASSLYVSSFTDHEITQMNEITTRIFNKLKQTLSTKMQEAQWAKEEAREELLKKIEILQLALPVASYFKNRNSLYNEFNVSELILSDNYFNNSMILLKRYRTLMYTELRRQIGDPKQIWTYYATPFQPKAEVIYALNLIMIPYGIIDWSLINDESSFDYLLLARLGNLIAHQIAHHFDANGIYYWNQTRNINYSLMYENEPTDTIFEEYISCQRDNLYQESINWILPLTDQTVSFKIPQLTLNERLSEIMGLRLAYDTLVLWKSNAKPLPWIQLGIDQLFYLAYAQVLFSQFVLQ
ncbi:hypothetical protein P5V15_013952 [Pogonomyrmex californicus]